MKYKLIKEYPGSPKLGFITYDMDENKNYYGLDEENDKGWLHKTIIENSPEFWELVIEKDYEILSYIISKTNEIINFKNLDVNDDLNNKDYIKIHSIKRISDSEVFKIGDKFKALTGSKEIEEIQSIEILDNLVRARMYHTKTKGSAVRLLFKDFTIERLKQPLFTTEDKIDIFEGDCFYYLDTLLNLSELKTAKSCKEPNIINLKFSTKEKAEECILMNKPCLSLNEVFNIFKGKAGSIVEKRNILELVVKSKLK